MDMQTTTIPRHIAIVLDGNGRWAKARKRPRLLGHKKGVEAVRNIVKACSSLGVECLTIFAFSSENWKRPEDEIKHLMGLFMMALEREAKSLAKNNVRLRIIGDVTQFSDKLQKKIKEVEVLTSKSTGLNLTVAANYGGRWDVTESVKQLVDKVVSGGLQVSDITEKSISSHLCTEGFPDPDLFIRTGGDKRISNFMMWQMAYTELYFTDVLWPDFDKEQLDKAIADFSSRQRRFGKTGEQVQEEKTVAARNPK